MEKRPEYRKLYKTARWARMRATHLRDHPLCAFCWRAWRRETLAEVLDHITPHKGDLTLFYDRDNVQSLCKRCHDSVKQREERGFAPAHFGVDGYSLYEKSDQEHQDGQDAV